MGQPNFSRVKRSIWQQMGRQQHFAERLIKFARHLSGPTHPVTREMPGRCAVAFTIKLINFQRDRGASIARSVARLSALVAWSVTESRLVLSKQKGDALNEKCEPGVTSAATYSIRGPRNSPSSICNYCTMWCPGAESNHRHRDFQSHSLPFPLSPRHSRLFLSA